MSGPDRRPLDLPEVIELIPRRFSDNRGYFSEVWRDGWLEPAGVSVTFVQDNHSLSRPSGTVRGLHFQLAPAAQDKLVRVVRGSVFDVAVDIRPASPSFGRWVATTLSADAGNMLFIPRGFAHGFQTLEDDCEVVYKVSAAYDRALDRAFRWDDPAVGVDWPIRDAPMLSPKDAAAPLLSEITGEL